MSVELEDQVLETSDEEDEEMTGGEHGEIVALISTGISNFVYANSLGRVFDGQTSFELPGVSGSKRPDVAFVQKGRLPQRVAGNVILAPDLAVEVISPSETVGGVQAKIRDYMQSGVKLLWVVEPSDQVIRVYEPGLPFRLLRESDDLAGTEGVLVGFRLPVRVLFTEDDKLIGEVFARLLSSSQQ